MPQRRTRRRLKRIHRLQELSKLLVGQHSRHKSRSVSSGQRGIGYIRGITKPQQEPRELSNKGEPWPLGFHAFFRVVSLLTISGPWGLVVHRSLVPPAQEACRAAARFEPAPDRHTH